MNKLQARHPLVARLMAGRRDALLRHGPVRPTWSADSRCFWYATRGNDGLEHVLVDRIAGTRQPLFDATALARALGEATGAEVAPGGMALERVGFDPATQRTTFAARGRRWCWDPRAQRLDDRGPAVAASELLSPDGRQVVFLDGPNLRLRGIDDHDSRALTDDGVDGFGWGDFTDYTTLVQRRLGLIPHRPHALWSPDSTRLAVLRIDRRPVKTLTLVQAVGSDGVRPVAHTYPFPMVCDPPEQRERAEIWLLGLDGSRVRVAIDPLHTFMHRAFSHGQGRWSADGRCFDVVDFDRLTRWMTLWRVDARDGSARRLLHEEGPALVRAAPTLAMTPMLFALADGSVIGWSQRSGWGHLELHRLDGSSTPITQGEWQVRSVLHVDEARRRIVFTAGGREHGVDPYFDLPYAVDFDGRNLQPLAADAPPAHHALIEPPYAGNGEAPLARSVSPDGSCFVDTWSTVSLPPRSVLRSAQDGRVLLELESADASDAWPAELPLPEPFSVRSIDGSAELWGLLYKPAHFDATRRYPVVEVIYAAPQMAVVPKGWSPGVLGSLAEQLAASGHVAFVIDGPGTPMRSHAFQLASHGRLEFCASLPDHRRAIEQLAGSRPWMDLARVGIVGGSGGGFATVRALAEHGDFFKAGASLCGSHDSTGYIPYWGEMFHGAWDEALYARQDNNRIVDRIEGALLLVHGELDDNVHLATTMRLVRSLIAADRDFELLVVPGAGHIMAHDPYVVRRVIEFFQRRL